MKSVQAPEYAVFCDMLRQARGSKRQGDVAALLGVPQTYVSAYELGKVRLDFVQLRNWCAACGLTLAQFVEAFEQKWAEHKGHLEDLEQIKATRQAAAQASARPMSSSQHPQLAAGTVGKTKRATGGKATAKKAPRS